MSRFASCWRRSGEGEGFLTITTRGKVFSGSLRVRGSDLSVLPHPKKLHEGFLIFLTPKRPGFYNFCVPLKVISGRHKRFLEFLEAEKRNCQRLQSLERGLDHDTS